MKHKMKSTIFEKWKSLTAYNFAALEAHGQVVPFWKPPISQCLEPGDHEGGRTIRAQNP